MREKQGGEEEGREEKCVCVCVCVCLKESSFPPLPGLNNLDQIQQR